MGVTSRKETSYPCKTPEDIPVLVEFMLHILQYSAKCFVDHRLSFCPFAVDHCIVCTSMYHFYLSSFGV
jgi:hypothetical protein